MTIKVGNQYIHTVLGYVDDTGTTVITGDPELATMTGKYSDTSAEESADPAAYAWEEIDLTEPDEENDEDEEETGESDNDLLFRLAATQSAESVQENLVTGTNQGAEGWQAGTGTIEDAACSPEENGTTVNGVRWTAAANDTLSRTADIAGEAVPDSVTVSFWWNASEQCGLTVSIGDNGSEKQRNYDSADLDANGNALDSSGAWLFFEALVPISATADSYPVKITADSAATIDLCDFKVEAGDKTTDWTTAYKETKEQVDGLTTIIKESAQLTWCTVEKGTEDLSALKITDNTVVYFPAGAYTVAPWTLSGLKNVTILLDEAVITCAGDYFLSADNCDDIRVCGGRITGAALYAVLFKDCKRAKLERCEIANIGGTASDAPAGVRVFGDCTGFMVENCRVHDVSSQYVSSDGYIHSYGIFVNRLSSSNAFSQLGKIVNCYLYNIAGIDGGSVKADGDGIFIQGPPYLDADSNVVWREPQIIIDRCIVQDCKKRGAKIAADGVSILNSIFSGEFWYAAIDLQYGHGRVVDSSIQNNSDYNGSITSGIVASDGGFEVRGCTIRCPYQDSDGNTKYHPGIRLDKRLSGSVIDSTVPWERFIVSDCYFDQVSRAIFANTSNADAPTYTLEGMESTGCRFGVSNQSHVVDISATVFPEIGTFRFVDFRFDAGSNRTEVKAANSNFTYPAGISADPTVCFELHSRYWTEEPMSGYSGLPTSPHTKIVYAGNISGIRYKEYTGYGSRTFGTKAPASITATLAKQLLYNSKVGDQYTDVTTGTVYICTAAGTDSTIGTWSDISSGGSGQTYADGNEVAY